MPPRTRSKSPPPPECMTWGGALPLLVIAGILDALRYFFLFFWFFGPAIVASQTNSVVGLAVGVFTGPALTIFGVIMSIAVAIAGFLIVFITLAFTDFRIFERETMAPLWFLAGIGASLTLMTWRLYATQIKQEKAELKKWEAQYAATSQRDRTAQVAYLNAQRAAQQQEAESEQENEIPDTEPEPAY